MMKTLQQISLHALEELKAIDIVTLDVKKLTTITDVMIICSARSSRHCQALADNVVQQVKAHQYPLVGIDGKQSTEWVLIDLGDVVVHVMMPSARELYALEKLWSI